MCCPQEHIQCNRCDQESRHTGEIGPILDVIEEDRDPVHPMCGGCCEQMLTVPSKCYERLNEIPRLACTNTDRSRGAVNDSLSASHGLVINTAKNGTKVPSKLLRTAGAAASLRYHYWRRRSNRPRHNESGTRWNCRQQTSSDSCWFMRLSGDVSCQRISSAYPFEVNFDQ